jgi:hypothetical protein
VTRRLLAMVAAVLLVGLGAAACGKSGSSTRPKPATPDYTAPPPSLPASPVTLSTSPPPWLPPAVIDNGALSPSYVKAAGLPTGEEMLKVHYHAHLDVIVNGKKVSVPPYVGMVANAHKITGLAPLHTHADDGIIHIENSVPAKFVLGQFFIEWGVRFTPTCLGPYCTGGGNELAVFLNGKRYAADPTQLVLASHQEIAVEFGPAGKLPPPPSSFKFPTGN